MMKHKSTSNNLELEDDSDVDQSSSPSRESPVEGYYYDDSTGYEPYDDEEEDGSDYSEASDDVD